MIEQKPVRAPAPDLLERARSEAINWSATCGRLFDELADEIERLTDLVDAAGKQNMQHMELAKERRELAEALEAEVERLRGRFDQKCDDIEWVARAIYAESPAAEVDDWDRCISRREAFGFPGTYSSEQERAFRYARAAIAAMEGQPKEQPHDR